MYTCWMVSFNCPGNWQNNWLAAYLEAVGLCFPGLYVVLLVLNLPLQQHLLLQQLLDLPAQHTEQQDYYYKQCLYTPVHCPVVWIQNSSVLDPDPGLCYQFWMKNLEITFSPIN